MAKTRTDYNAYMRVYMLNRYRSRRAAALAQLGGKCRQCGSVDDLEIDHIDRAAKSLDLGKLWSCAASKFAAELTKCQLLCATCHHDKSIRDLGFKPNKGVHGTLGNYQKYGCRCVECRTANTSASLKYKK